MIFLGFLFPRCNLGFLGINQVLPSTQKVTDIYRLHICFLGSTIEAMGELIAVDIGTRYTKVYTQTKKKRMVPSEVGVPPVLTKATGGSIIVPQPMIVGVDRDPPFVFGFSAQRHSTATYGPADSVGFYAAMTLALLGEEKGDKFTVILGVPLWLKQHEEIIKPITGGHGITYQKDVYSQRQIIEVKKIIPIPSIFGTFYLTEPTDEAVGIVDIGYTDTTIALFRGGRFVPEKSGQLTPRLKRTLTAVRKIEKVSDGVIDKRLSEGEPKQMSKDLLAEFAKEVMRYAISRWRNENLAGVYLTGGGAELVKDFFTDKRIVVVEDAIYANCAGLLSHPVEMGSDEE